MSRATRCMRRLPRLVVALITSFVANERALGQRVFLYSEPTICSTPFRPISGYTFHAGGQWSVTWNTMRGQFGSAAYAGYPNPVKSVDGQKIWENPTAYVECWVDWYIENGGEQAYYRWHVLDYGGDVRDCTSSDSAGSSGRNGLPAEYDPYDPYDPWGCSDPYEGGGGGQGEGGGAGCRVEYVFVDISYDGGNTWHTLWEGWASVC